MTLEELLKYSSPPEENNILSGKDINKLFWKYKGLLKERERNNSYWASSNDNLKLAYEKLDEQESKLDRAYRLNKKFLDNIKEGLLLIDKNLIIQSQYSTFLTEMFQTHDIAGKNIIDFIYPIKTYAVERKELEKYLSILFKKLLADPEMIDFVNPLKNKTLLIETPKGTNKVTIDASFIRIYENQIVENIMIIFEDKTNIIKLQEKLENEKNLYESELESISAILKIGPVAVSEFVNESKIILSKLKNNMNKLYDIDILNMLFRDMHSLKGSAKYLGLKYISSLADKMEDIFALLKSGKKRISNDIISEIESLCNQFDMEFNNFKKLMGKFSIFSESINGGRRKTDNVGLDLFFNSLTDMVTEISNELNKKVKLIIHSNVNNLPFLSKLKNPIIHILRNSIDHGIENIYERLENKKNAEGIILLKIQEENNYYTIDIQDDGKGLDFEKIKKKVIDNKILKIPKENITDNDLLKTIFLPDFSLKDDASEISGRGYGLNVVKDVVTGLKGKILVATKKNTGTKFTLKIPR